MTEQRYPHEADISDALDNDIDTMRRITTSGEDLSYDDSQPLRFACKLGRHDITIMLKGALRTKPNRRKTSTKLTFFDKSTAAQQTFNHGLTSISP